MDFNLNIDKRNAFDKSLVYDILIVGSGPAGLNAALYAKRKGMIVGILSKKNGGQVIDTTTVENYLGIEEASGEGLVKMFMQHVNSLKVPILKDVDVSHFEKTDGLFSVYLSSGEQVKSKTLIVATGSKPRRLGVPGEDAYMGKGVAYCAICDGPLFEGMDVIVAGGGNSAVEAAIDLSKIANSVTLVHRSQLRADQIVVEKLEQLKNVKIILETEIKEVVGEQLLKGIKTLDKKTGKESFVEAAGLFVEIGYLPNNGIAKDKIDMNKRGEIVVNALNETSVSGVFAAGDVTNIPYKQIVIAASEGAKSALTANDYINRG